ncbi:MAG: ABC transporter substrate-binding protein [Chloroflexi bacterium]|nr:ABC transporter substrate-binding protein [Chloroflexota bacterium]
MRIWRIETLAALGLVVSALLAACKPALSPSTPPSGSTTPPGINRGTTSTATAPTGPYGDLRIAVATWGEERFEPPLVTATGHVVLNPIFDWMIRADKGQMTPGAIEKWVMAPDGLSWTYSVRKGMKFHNGDQLTARDVKFSFDQYMRKDAFFSNTTSAVNRVDVVDDNTVKIFTKGVQPYLPTLQSVASVLQGLVMPKSYVESNGWQYASAHPVGSGPFKFVSHAGGDSVTYQANDSYWAGAPAFKNLALILMPEETTRVATVRTGVVDIAEINLDSVPQLEAAGFRTAAVDQTEIAVQLHGTYDSRAAKSAVADIRVRKALSISINREEIMSTFFRGKAGPPMPPYTTESTMEIDVSYWKKYVADLYSYDPEQAKQLLKEAGYPNGFSLKLYSFPVSGTPWLPKVFEIIAGYWSKIGVKPEIVPIDLAVWTSWRKGPAEPLVGQSIMMRFPGGNSAPRSLELPFSTKQANALVSGANPELDKLIDAIYAEPDANKRKEIIARGLKMGIDTYTVFEICSAPSMLGLGPRVDLSSWSLPLAAPQFTAFAGYIKHER